jgi:Ser/Thr protein kinase RdoA (MazF antagonist)
MHLDATPPSATPPSAGQPFAGLTPDAVLDALDSVGLRGDGRLIQLNSYENRVFQVFLEDGRVVVAKFYRPGRWRDAQILEEHSFATELAEAEIPVVAPWSLQADPLALRTGHVLGTPATLGEIELAGQAHRFSVSPRCSGQAPELENDETLAWIGRFLGRMHAVGRRQHFAERRTLNVAHFGVAARHWLAEHHALPDEASALWLNAADHALAAAQALQDRVGEVATLRLHGDCHPGNILWTSAGPHFVDLDDAVNGPAVQDLWMLLPSERPALTQKLNVLLEGYEQFAEFDWRELRLIEVLRTVRMIHHSAWIAQRWHDPAFPVAFPWFAHASYWQQQATQLREQSEALQEAADRDMPF